MPRIIAALATLAAAGATIVATPSGAEAATTWQAHDKNCKAGSACAEVQKRVTDSGSVTCSWSSGGVPKDLCSGGCTPKTTAWTSSWSPVQTTAGAYVARGTMTGDYLMVGASWSAWNKVAGRRVTYSAGEVRVNRHERGYRTIGHERGQIQVKPKSGQQIEPRWVRVGHVVNGASNSQTTDLCDPSCTRRTTDCVVVQADFRKLVLCRLAFGCVQPRLED